MQLVRPLRRVKTVDVQTETRSCTGAAQHRASPRARTASHVHRLQQAASVGLRSWAAHGAASDMTPDHQSTSHQIPGKRCESSHHHLHGRRHRRDSHRSANLVARSVRPRVGRWQRRCRRAIPREHARIGGLSAITAQMTVWFRAVRAIHTQPPSRQLGIDAPRPRERNYVDLAVFRPDLPYERVERLSAEREASPLRAHATGGVKMAQQRVITSLVVVLAFACADERRLCANAGDHNQRQHRHQGIRVSRPRQWPRRQPIRSPVVGCCRYSRTTIGWTCRSTPEIECRAT